MPRESFFSVANLLSLSRLPLGLLFAVVLVAPWGGIWPALVVLAAAGLTDALDGYVARQEQARRLANAGFISGGAGVASDGAAVTALSAARSAAPVGSLQVDTPAGTGSWLDPICDKVFVATVLGAIWVQSRPPVGLLALILARELVQLPLSAVYAAVPALRQWLRYDFRASALGKAATVSQFVAITALLFESPATPVAAVVSCAVGFCALADYVVRAIRLGQLRRRQGQAGAAATAAATDR